MATLETQAVDAVLDNTRRRMLTVGGAALAGLALASYTPKAEAALVQSDTDILNFALNLEYLEANYYNLAVYGVTIDKLPTPIAITGTGTAGTVVTKTPFAKVPFTAGGLIQAYATETALEEGKHVSFLQSVLGSAAVAQPQIDLVNSFNTLAGATTPPIGTSFDPFASETNFLIGAFIFEDTGVSAYHGAAPLITDKVNVLPAAVGIHAVEAYHAGLVRTSIAAEDAANSSTTLSGYTVAIANLRLALSVAAAGATDTPSDIGLMTNATVTLEGASASYPAATLVDANSGTATAPLYSIAQGRNYKQILSIVTAGNGGAAPGTTVPTYKGLFFPNGLNGNLA